MPDPGAAGAAREAARFGPRILPGGDMHDQDLGFRDWAARYDDPGFAGRNRARHEAWLAVQTAPVLRVDGRWARDRMVGAVIAHLEGRG